VERGEIDIKQATGDPLFDSIQQKFSAHKLATMTGHNLSTPPGGDVD
jgi:hypothetical protein